MIADSVWRFSHLSLHLELYHEYSLIPIILAPSAPTKAIKTEPSKKRIQIQMTRSSQFPKFLHFPPEKREKEKLFITIVR